MMTQTQRTVLLAGGLFIAATYSALLGASDLTDGEIRELVSKLKDYRVKFRVIAIGQPAMLPLFDLLDDKDERTAFEATSVLRWIAIHAAEEVAKRPPVVATLDRVIQSKRSLRQREVATKLLGLAGGDGAVAVLAPLLRDENLRQAALAALIEIDGKVSTKAMMDVLPSVSGDFRCALLRALGDRRDPAVTSVLVAAAKDKGEKVCLAALEALGASQDPAGMAAVIDGMKGGTPAVKGAAALACIEIADACLAEGKAKEAKDAYYRVLALSVDDVSRAGALKGLGRMGDPAVTATLVSALGKGSPVVKAAGADACLQLAGDLLEKGDVAAAAALYDRVLHSPTREADQLRALAGMACVADPQSVAKIAPFLKSKDYRVQAAAASALRAIKGSEATRALSSALKDASPRQKLVLLAALKGRRDAAAVQDIVPLVNSADEEIRIAAIQAIGSIGDGRGAGALVPAMEKGEFKVKSAAFDAYVAIGDAELARENTAEALKIYHKALEMGAKKEAQASAFAGLARIADPASLPIIEPVLDKLKKKAPAEALAAYIAIGDRLSAGGKREEAVKIFSKSLSLGADNADSLKQKLRKLGEKMEFQVKGGKVVYWWIIGPFPAPDIASWEKALFPEKEVDLTKEYDVNGKKLRWKPIETKHKDALVDLESVLGKNDNVVAYAYAEVVSKNEQDVFLRSGSDDGLLIWVNGERVFAFLEPRSPKVDEDKVKAHLKKGPNALLLKICEKGGGWGFCLRVTDAQERNLDFGLR